MGGDVEFVTGARGLPLIGTSEFVFTSTHHTFHDFWRGGIERQMRRHDHADRFFFVIGQNHGMADAFAIEKHIGFGGDADAGNMLGDHGSSLILDSFCTGR